MSDCSDYSQETLDIANQVFFTIEERLKDNNLVKMFEYLIEKKYSYGMKQYFHHLLSPENLIALSRADCLHQIKKAFEIAMMIHVRPSEARDHHSEATLLKLSPKLYEYSGNARNKQLLKDWSFANHHGPMPRILARLIDSEAKAFQLKWEPFAFQWY